MLTGLLEVLAAVGVIGSLVIAWIGVPFLPITTMAVSVALAIYAERRRARGDA